MGAEHYAQVRAEHHAVVRMACMAQGGREVDTQGDGFFFAFARAPDAVTAAAHAQQVLAAHPWSHGTPVRVRMGLHTGTPLMTASGYVGLDVHRAARIAASGHGGQVLLSQTTRDLVEQELPTGTLLRDLGLHRLKDLQQPEHLHQVLIEGLPADFAPLKTLDQHAHNLPLQPTPLLGREREVAELCSLLRREDVHLVTLTGPGGVGKTRLALQVAAEVVDAFADGVWFVRLARLSDPSLVIPTIAETLGLQEAGSQPIQAVLQEWVRTKQLLLLLDNCEQVAEAAPALADLLAHSRGLTVLATSRVMLHLQGERGYPVAPLALPPLPLVSGTGGTGGPLSPEHLAALAASPAVALFIACSQAHQPDFQLTAANAVAVAEICSRLDGLPLALGLAAARVKLLPPQQLLQRLEWRLPLLRGGAQDVEARQQTMHNTLAWSEGLLSPAERRLFRRLAVFVGSFTLEAAEAVCATPAGAEPLGLDVLEGLERLLDQSLVQPWQPWPLPAAADVKEAARNAAAAAATGAGVRAEARFRLLYVVREYALERLEASTGSSTGSSTGAGARSSAGSAEGKEGHEGNETEALRQAHAAYYVDRVEQGRVAAYAGLQTFAMTLADVDRLERDLDNLRAALGWLRTRAEQERTRTH
ncbi:MAG TPA: NB-ARC domain-containing protein, partial [Longimicrobiales bacterium]